MYEIFLSKSSVFEMRNMSPKFSASRPKICCKILLKMKRKSKKKFPESHENATFRRFKAFMLEVVIFLSEHCPKIVKRNDGRHE